MPNFLYSFYGLNESLFVLINSITNIGFLPHILYIISSIFFIGNFALIYSLLCIYFYCKILRMPDRADYFWLVYYRLFRIGICYALFGITFAILKFSVNLPRPFCSLQKYQYISIADIASKRCLSSFPSAHTGMSIFVAYFLWSYFDIKGKIALLFIIAMVTISRIALAMHYPSDIFYSAIVTYLVICISRLIYKKAKRVIITPFGSFALKYFFSRKN